MSSTASVVTDAQQPVSSVALPDGAQVFDFGLDAFGWAEVFLPPGRWTLRLGETLARDGHVNLSPGGTIRATEVTFPADGSGFLRVPTPPDIRNTTGVNGKATAIPIPRQFGIVMPFRYLEIVNCPSADATKIRRHVLHWPINMKASEFECSDARLKKIFDFCKYSIWATSFAGVYVDGDRERIPYEADAYLNLLGHYAIDADFEMGRRTFDILMKHPTWPTEWAQHMIMIAWTDWMYSGSTILAARYYDQLKNDKLLLDLARDDGLLVSFPSPAPDGRRDIVDWPVGERDGFDFRPVNAVVNAFHYLNLREMHDLAVALGFQNDANFFAQQADKVLNSFQSTFFMSDSCLYADGEGSTHASLHANAAALAFNLVPPQHINRVADFLVAKGMACSVYFAQYLLEALFKAGRDEDAIRLMVSDSNRSWLGMMAQGSTITMEAWSLEAKPNQDWNHAWGTAPLNIIVRYILGIRPTLPGFASYTVDSHRATLKVSGIVPTIRGPIRV